MNNDDKDFSKNGFLGFVLKYIGIIMAILAIGLVSAFSTGNTAMLIFTLAIAVVFFLVLIVRWDTYKRGAMFTLAAVCVNVEHVSKFRTDYVFESIPEDDSTEPQIFIMAERRTKFRKYQQGVPYIMFFGMHKNCRELTSENLVTASKRVESYDGGRPSRGYIDLDTLTDVGDAEPKSHDDETDGHTAEVNLPEEEKPLHNPLSVASQSSEREGGSQ